MPRTGERRPRAKPHRLRDADQVQDARGHPQAAARERRKLRPDRADASPGVEHRADQSEAEVLGVPRASLRHAFHADVDLLEQHVIGLHDLALDDDAPCRLRLRLRFRLRLEQLGNLLHAELPEAEVGAQLLRRDLGGAESEARERADRVERGHGRRRRVRRKWIARLHGTVSLLLRWEVSVLLGAGARRGDPMALRLRASERVRHRGDHDGGLEEELALEGERRLAVEESVPALADDQLWDHERDDRPRLLLQDPADPGVHGLGDLTIGRVEDLQRHGDAGPLPGLRDLRALLLVHLHVEAVDLVGAQSTSRIEAPERGVCSRPRRGRPRRWRQPSIARRGSAPS
jgi:hypothetical protein